MAESSQSDINSTPWHLWVVGVIALLWSAMDYVLSDWMDVAGDAFSLGFAPAMLLSLMSRSRLTEVVRGLLKTERKHDENDAKFSKIPHKYPALLG